ncbi:small ribosomal subunit protein mS79 (rPPR3b)-like [Magnolia sinica]|uniref:small ribosomal subunit protein mS79 (rPPR3b)-like n=1 Tax=Magnolia sinica TaxID=86752 RepID=UPI0026588832|nr:small ribosomal subunit protein mS79 (rPPR3b)-like [Magnolia sinica]
MFDHARDLFDELPQLNCPRTTKSFNALLTSALDSQLFAKVPELFDALPSKISVKPDVFSYSILIQALCKMGSLDSAVSALEMMELNGVRPSLITFNHLLNGLYTGSRFSDAEKLWFKMEEYNCVPDVTSYNERLRGLVLEGKTEEAVKLVGEFGNRGLKPNVFSFNSLGYCNDGNVEEAKRILSELVKNDCAPNRRTFETLIPCACEKGDLDLAVKLCKECVNRRCFVDVQIVQSVVDVLVRESRVKMLRPSWSLGCRVVCALGLA